MAIGERIHFFRLLRGMTQKYLGQAVGFPEKSADVRLAQYETGTRTPKADLTKELAEQLAVSPAALNVPNIDNYIGLLHTLFALEDIYGLKVDKLDGEICLRLVKRNGKFDGTLFDMLSSWQTMAEQYDTGYIDKEAYDHWRYNYPLPGKDSPWLKDGFQLLSDSVIRAMNAVPDEDTDEV